MVVVNLPFDDFLGEFDTRSLLSFLLCAGTFFTLVYLTGVWYAGFYRQWVKSRDVMDADAHCKLLQRISGASV